MPSTMNAGMDIRRMVSLLLLATRPQLGARPKKQALVTAALAYLLATAANARSGPTRSLGGQIPVATPSGTMWHPGLLSGGRGGVPGER